MAEATTVETNGTTNRIKGKVASKFGRLYALASKATGKTFTLRRSFDDGTRVNLRFDGFPDALTPAGVAEHASETGGRVVIAVDVGASNGRAGGLLGGTAAAEMVKELTTE